MKYKVTVKFLNFIFDDLNEAVRFATKAYGAIDEDEFTVKITFMAEEGKHE